MKDLICKIFGHWFKYRGIDVGGRRYDCRICKRSKYYFDVDIGSWKGFTYSVGIDDNIEQK